MAITGTRPSFAVAKERVLLGAYVSGAIKCVRLLNDGTTVLSYPASATGTITTGADDDQFGLTRLFGAGDTMMAAVSKGGSIHTYLSRDDGATWEEVT